MTSLYGDGIVERGPVRRTEIRPGDPCRFRRPGPGPEFRSTCGRARMDEPDRAVSCPRARSSAAEQETLNLSVVGSSPTGLTNQRSPNLAFTTLAGRVDALGMRSRWPPVGPDVGSRRPPASEKSCPRPTRRPRRRWSWIFWDPASRTWPLVGVVVTVRHEARRPCPHARVAADTLQQPCPTMISGSRDPSSCRRGPARPLCFRRTDREAARRRTNEDVHIDRIAEAGAAWEAAVRSYVRTWARPAVDGS